MAHQEAKPGLRDIPLTPTRVPTAAVEGNIDVGDHVNMGSRGDRNDAPADGVAWLQAYLEVRRKWCKGDRPTAAEMRAEGERYYYSRLHHKLDHALRYRYGEDAVTDFDGERFSYGRLYDLPKGGTRLPRSLLIWRLHFPSAGGGTTIPLS